MRPLWRGNTGELRAAQGKRAKIAYQEAELLLSSFGCIPAPGKYDFSDHANDKKGQYLMER